MNTTTVTAVKDYTVGGQNYWYFTFSTGRSMKILQASSESLETQITNAERRLLALKYMRQV